MGFLGKTRAFLVHPVTRRVFRVTRVAVLGGGLVYSGYLLGSLTVLKDPKRFELEYLQQALSRHAKVHETEYFTTVSEKWLPTRDPALTNVHDWVQAVGFSEESLHTTQTKASELADGANLTTDLSKIHRVSTRVLNASRIIVRERLEELKIAAETGQSVLDFEEYDMNLMQLEEADRLLNLEEWKFTYLHSTDEECFVNHYAPRRIFITKGMIDLCKKVDSDAPLAMAIGHELSHTILNHGENDEWLDVGLKVGQLMVLSLLDPTGLLTLGLETALVFTSPLARTHYSHSQTCDADALSLKMAAQACYDPNQAVKFLSLVDLSSQTESEPSVPVPTLDDAASTLAGPEFDVSGVPSGGTSEAAVARAAPQPSQVGFADGMLQRAMSISPSERREKARTVLPIAQDIFDSAGCATWRRAADEFLGDLKAREKQRMRYKLQDIGQMVGFEPADDNRNVLSSADVGGIIVGGATISALTLTGVVAMIIRW